MTRELYILCTKPENKDDLIAYNCPTNSPPSSILYHQVHNSQAQQCRTLKSEIQKDTRRFGLSPSASTANLLQSTEKLFPSSLIVYWCVNVNFWKRHNTHTHRVPKRSWVLAQPAPSRLQHIIHYFKPCSHESWSIDPNWKLKYKSSINIALFRSRARARARVTVRINNKGINSSVLKI